MRAAIAIGLALLVAGATAARADSKAADEKFRIGKRLEGQKKFAEACKAFEESNALDPTIGAELNVAHCFEEWGKLATAYRAYLAAESMATAANDPRVAKIHERVAGLDALVPRATIKVAKDADTRGLTLTLDGEPFAVGDLGKERMLDPGPHQLAYHVASGVSHTKVIHVDKDGESEITLDLPVAVLAKAHEPPPVEQDAHAPGHGRRVAGVATAGAGAVAMVAAGVLTFSAHSKYTKALSADCGGDTTMCDAAGLKATHDARHSANVATIVFGVGAAMAATGVVLYVTSSHGRGKDEHATRLVPTAGPGAGGVVLLGSF